MTKRPDLVAIHPTLRHIVVRHLLQILLEVPLLIQEVPHLRLHVLQVRIVAEEDRAVEEAAAAVDVVVAVAGNRF